MEPTEDTTRGALRTLACFAVNEEAAPFAKLIPKLANVELLVTGMGRQNADRAVRERLDHNPPGLVLSCGFAGGLNPELGPGDIVFAADAVPRLQSDLLKAGAHQVRFYCSERVVTTVERKRALRELTGADAVEMESQAIGLACQEHGVPFVVVRVILDPAREGLPLDFNRLLTPEQRLDFWKLARELVKSPGKLRALLQLRKQSRMAAGKLAVVLAGILSASR